jgi:hypothetical protein
VLLCSYEDVEEGVCSVGPRLQSHAVRSLSAIAVYVIEKDTDKKNGAYSQPVNN